ncbi:hypothetical protein CBR_g36234 [Chara braunii]|uniref:Starch synthase catalytic domain-containing protein n=1 Tax=Chara braunii TaxID=69332 RepID=A0A388LKE0_CHABU|nr:hypothetical protein CBR_g36234 [Chara braunii]|eukprot:GBG82705.1 hypothetical protein CBR_g36234 [Chara braunii]
MPAAMAKVLEETSGRRRRRRRMSLVFVGAEVAPWSKVGGLADVMGALPPALAARGHRVMSISPRYDQYRDAWDTETTAEVGVGDRGPRPHLSI